jgi:hypothetical protein
MSIAASRPRRTTPTRTRKDRGRQLEWFLNVLLAAVLFAPLVISLYRLFH